MTAEYVPIIAQQIPTTITKEQVVICGWNEDMITAKSKHRIRRGILKLDKKYYLKFS